MENHGEERRKNGGLSNAQIEAITEAILAKIYEDIGRSIVKKLLWASGAVIFTVAAWIGKDHILLK